MNCLEIVRLEMSTQRVEPGLFTLRKIKKAWESLQSWYAHICLAVWSGLHRNSLSSSDKEAFSPLKHHGSVLSLPISLVTYCKGRTLNPLTFWELSTQILQHTDCSQTRAQHTAPSLSHRRQAGWVPVTHHTPRFQCLHSEIRSYPEQQLQLNCCWVITLCSTWTEIVLVTACALWKQQPLKYCTRALSERGLLRH